MRLREEAVTHGRGADESAEESALRTAAPGVSAFASSRNPSKIIAALP